MGLPLSTSAIFTQLLCVCGTQPIFSEIGSTAAQRDG